MVLAEAPEGRPLVLLLQIRMLPVILLHRRCKVRVKTDWSCVSFVASYCRYNVTNSPRSGFLHPPPDAHRSRLTTEVLLRIYTLSVLLLQICASPVLLRSRVPPVLLSTWR
jgi:hypothetical protein